MVDEGCRSQALELYQAFTTKLQQAGYVAKLADVQEAVRILKATPALQREVLLASIDHDRNYSRSMDYRLDELVGRLLQRKLPWQDEDFPKILRWTSHGQWGSGLKHAIKAVEHFAADHELSQSTCDALASVACVQPHAQGRSAKEFANIRSAIAVLLGEVAEEQVQVATREPWAQRMLDDLEQLNDDVRPAMKRVIHHASTATGGKPSNKWLKHASALLEDVDGELVTAAFQVWFDAFDLPADSSDDWHDSPWSVSELNADMMKGLIWTASLLKNEALIRAIGKAGQSGQRKIPGLGPRGAKVTNAAVWALGQIDHQLAIGQLAILKSRIKNKSVQKQIDKAMNEVAVRLGVPADQVEEMAVPTFGLTEVGKRVEQLGDFTAELAVTGTTSTVLRWFKPDGKQQKTVPKIVKDEYADELKELKAAAKDIQKLLPAQRERIDNLFLRQHVWTFSDWSELYLDHVLVGPIARRIIWEFGSDSEWVAGIWHDGALVDVSEQPLLVDPEACDVRLWHPIEQQTDNITAWRDFLNDHQISQPFKQAHREIYLLTDAERETATYSNRYAAHILKQHQFNALCGARRWKNSLRLMVDDSYPPASRDLPEWNLRAEFWVEGVGDNYGVDTNETGTYLYLATDQVRFYAVDASQNLAHAIGGGYESSNYRGEGESEPIQLTEVPPLVFSEVMRDVDLFVGVSSVGNDPNWSDGGPDGQYHDYWHSYSFGELTATAWTRKEILERLVPRLKIANQCSFRDKFLVVQGSRRTYKIHLGSGNILMEPNDQYLCIVPRAASINSATGKVFLPFEGDRTMSIILSKAFMLAEDTKITDRTILSQIG